MQIMSLEDQDTLENTEESDVESDEDQRWREWQGTPQTNFLKDLKILFTKMREFSLI